MLNSIKLSTLRRLYVPDYGDCMGIFSHTYDGVVCKDVNEAVLFANSMGLARTQFGSGLFDRLDRLNKVEKTPLRWVLLSTSAQYSFCLRQFIEDGKGWYKPVSNGLLYYFGPLEPEGLHHEIYSKIQGPVVGWSTHQRSVTDNG